MCVCVCLCVVCGGVGTCTIYSTRSAYTPDSTEIMST